MAKVSPVSHHELLRGIALARGNKAKERSRLTLPELLAAIQAAANEPEGPTRYAVDGSIKLTIRQAHQRERWGDLGAAVAEIAQKAASEKRSTIQKTRQGSGPEPVKPEEIADALGVDVDRVKARVDEAEAAGQIEVSKDGITLSHQGLSILGGLGYGQRLEKINRGRKELGLPPLTQRELDAMDEDQKTRELAAKAERP